MARPTIAGIDLGNSLVKACWQVDGRYVFETNTYEALDELRGMLRHVGITRLHVAGGGKAEALLDGFEVVRPSVPFPQSEFELQADGMRRLLAAAAA